MEALVNKIIPFSSVDGPGNRTAIFLQGCNMNCRYCHNPETRDKNWDSDLCQVELMDEDAVLEQIKKQIPFISGITVSGGECMLWPEFLTALFLKVKKLGLTTLIDSNGSVDFRKYPELLACTDGVMLDIKAFDNEIHQRITGVSNEMVLFNARYLAEKEKLLEVRCVISPSLYDGVEQVNKAGEYLRDLYRPGTFHFKLISYRPQGVREEYAHELTPGTDYMSKIANILKNIGYEDTIIV